MVNYYLAEACQNTFVLFDCLELSCVDESFLKKAHPCLLKENRDDALILFDGALIDHVMYAHLLVLGQDQALGEFCGNGARACAAYLFKKYPEQSHFYLITQHGKHSLIKYSDEIYSISLPPARFEWNKKFTTSPAQISHLWPHLTYVEMLEPHLVFNDKVSDAELLSLGREINQRRDLFPLGININCWHALEEGVLEVKTYERGVQRLTRSCGTGSMSCAAFYKKLGNVLVMTSGGPLEITIHKNTMELKGPAFCNENYL